MQIKGLLEMMFDKLAGWIDELIAGHGGSSLSSRSQPQNHDSSACSQGAICIC